MRYRCRNISGDRTANPQRIWNKILRARSTAFLQFMDVSKSAMMLQPSPFADPIMGIADPSIRDNETGGWPPNETCAQFPALRRRPMSSDHLNAAHGEIPVMMELWGMRSTSSLSSLPGPLWPGIVTPDRVLSMGQIELNCIFMLK